MTSTRGITGLYHAKETEINIFQVPALFCKTSYFAKQDRYTLLEQSVILSN